MPRINRSKLAWMLVLFAVSTLHAQDFQTVVKFDQLHGAHPRFDFLTQGIDGNYYGTTSIGGAPGTCLDSQGCGTFFRLTPGGKLTTLHSFGAPGDASYPEAGLLLATDGNLYGTSTSGGTGWGVSGNGAVFRIAPDGKVTVIYSFCSRGHCRDGFRPVAGLLEVNGKFYGTTYTGGLYGKPVKAGTVFQLTSDGKLKTLHYFCSEPNCGDGAFPSATLIQATNGYIYGMAVGGGKRGPGCPSECGTIFEINPAGTFKVVHRFEGADGGGPIGKLVQAADGNLYGVTATGGTTSCGDLPYGCGTIFKLSPPGLFTTLHTFCSDCSEGSTPLSLIQATDGNFYGTTEHGGTRSCRQRSQCGTIFRFTPSGELITLHNFDSGDGEDPSSGLMETTGGTFYGATIVGGQGNCDGYSCGTIYRLDVGLGPFVTFVYPAGKIGETGGILGQGFTGTTGVSLNGVPAAFTVVSDTYIRAIVPPGATSGYVTVATPSGTLTSDRPFVILR